MTKNIIGYSKDIEGIYKGLKDHIQKIPLIVYKEKDKKKHLEKMNELLMKQIMIICWRSARCQRKNR